MKRIVLVGVIILLASSCIQKKSLTVEGAWKLVSSLHYGFDSVPYHLPDENNNFKIYSENHVMYVGQYFYRHDLIQDYGFGTHAVKGGIITENITFHSNPTAVFGEEKMLLEIKNDTLIQTGTIDNTGKLLNKNDYFIHKYIRAR
jgi:hypothetical protein